ncbi:MAG: hypothetical protein NC120_08285 [Ruminococcus sp.]|nr:hypothetical protein [Ruminococcus sp.]
MTPLELTLAVTAAANGIAADIPDNRELALAAAVLVQLGETLETIAAQRELDAAE